MKILLTVLLLTPLGTIMASAGPALTIYNQNFAVVRDVVPLDLKAGVNEVRFTGVTAQVEPDSVVLRDPAGKNSLQILEQNYRNDPVSQELLLSLFEGKTIQFEKYQPGTATPTREIVSGKVIRSGYVPGGGSEQPIIDVNGQLQFALPGMPLFPGLGSNTVLQPTLHWLLQSAKSGKFDAEVGYITGGFSWEASYNLVAPEKGTSVDFIGWITMVNQSGKTFENAAVELMAGDVQKVQPQNMMRKLARARASGGGGGGEPVVTEKTFDEYHLYTLARSTTLHDRETKQVEFVHASGVQAKVIYVYDGLEPEYRIFSGQRNEERAYGTQSNKKVWVFREFENSETNQLGIPLPKGRLRFYRRNTGGQMEFTGEDTIDHTPRNETIRVATGSSFDLVGERKQTAFSINLFNPNSTGIDPRTGLPIYASRTNAPSVNDGPWINESFEVKLRNHKTESIEIRVVEHLYRWDNWAITEKSDPFQKTDAQTIEFRLPLKPDEEKTLTYTVHYTW